MTISNEAPRDAEDFSTDIDELGALVEKWSASGVTDETAADLHMDIDRAAALKKEAEAAHKAIKEPFLLGGRKVDDRFRPVKAATDDAVKALKSVLGTYLAEKQRLQEEAARQAREEAERLAREAQVDADDPLIGDEAMKAAEEANLQAARQERHAAAAGSSSVEGARTIGLRTYYVADIVDPAALVAHYANRPELIAAATKLANAEVRTLKADAKIPGVAVREEQRAA